ncbi:27 kDa hemolymph protein-like [Eupeodes corollae]|uniref:27 kDa hemolymph protein-like n=1 Tax=Eupeodes corollae TaxID=290404 RepID=UPI002491F207|nr:27 kDa hemolymph protein-like [Eupeodes corollae]
MHSWKWIIPLAIAFALILNNQSNAVPQNALDLLKNKFLPAEFMGKNFTADDAKKLLKDRCRKVSGDNETIFIQAHKGVLDFIKCISSLGDLTTIQMEIEIAKPIGELDTVFQKYCKKQNQVELCFKNLEVKIHPCLNEEEKARHSMISRVGSKMLKFVCGKGGDQIALFFAEQGPECLEEKKDEINNCMNESFAEYIPKNGLPDINNQPQIVMGKKECKDIENFEKCVLFHLGKCNDITPSNIIESVFKYVKNETECNAKPKLMTMTDRSSGSMIKTHISVTGALFLVVLLKSIIS